MIFLLAANAPTRDPTEMAVCARVSVNYDSVYVKCMMFVLVVVDGMKGVCAYVK